MPGKKPKNSKPKNGRFKKTFNAPQPSEEDIDGFMRGAFHGELDVVANFLKKYRSSIDVKDPDGDTALIKAAQWGYQEIVELLLGKGASVNVKDSYGETALMKAAEHGHIKTVESL